MNNVFLSFPLHGPVPLSASSVGATILFMHLPVVQSKEPSHHPFSSSGPFIVMCLSSYRPQNTHNHYPFSRESPCGSFQLGIYHGANLGKRFHLSQSPPLINVNHLVFFHYITKCSPLKSQKNLIDPDNSDFPIIHQVTLHTQGV